MSEVGDLWLLKDAIESLLRYSGRLKPRQPPLKYRCYKNRKGVRFKLREGVMDSVPIIETWWLNEYLRDLKPLEEGSVVVDIGAHIGAFSIFIAKKLKGAKIYAFEPGPLNFDLLKENIQTNRTAKKISPFNLAVGGETGKQLKLRYHPAAPAGSSTTYSFEGRGNSTGTQVSSISLEDIFKRHKISRCHLLKMDCEGAEYEILLSAPRQILDKIQNISLEYHGGGNIYELKNYLESGGFQVKLGRIIGPFMNPSLLIAQR